MLQMAMHKRAIEHEFIRFTYTDLDTIDTKIYDPASNFTQLIDSQRMRFSTNTGDTISFALSDKIQLDKHIEISLPSTGHAFRLTDFQTRREPCGCGQGNRKIVTAYKLDGVPYTGTEIYLKK